MSIAYSIGSGPKVKELVDKRANLSPGPAGYDAPNLDCIRDKSPEFSLTKGNRYKSDANGKPGPGQYSAEPSNKSSQIKFSIGSKTMRDKMFNDVDGSDRPGPGQYDQPILRDNQPTYSLGGKQKVTYNKNPGPGEYDISKMEKLYGSPNAKFGTQQRNTAAGFHSKNSKSIQQEPGPGAYPYNNGVGTVKNAQSGKFSNVGRDTNNFKVQSPGIVQYTKLQEYGKGGLKFSGRPVVSNKTIDMPGPGQYDEKSKVFSSAKAASSMSKSERKHHAYKQASASSLSLGPGKYDVTTFKNQRTPTIKFGTGKREVFSPSNNNPGPANYDSPMKSNTISFKIGEKISQKMNSNPGPGRYDHSNLQVTKSKGSTFKMGTSQRSNMINSKSISEMPGPQEYDQQCMSARVTTYTFGGKSKELYNKNPGPGEYDLSQSPNKTKSVAFKIGTGKAREEFVSKTAKEMPGPGNYTNEGQEFGKQVQCFSFTGKPEWKANKNPGPGQYNQANELTRAKSQSQRIGTTKRAELFGTEKASQMPGPGNYDQHNQFGQQVQTYNVFYTFGSKVAQKYNANPGPGAYQADQNQIKESSRTYVMGSEKRVLKFGSSKDEHSIPGPSDYNQLSSPNVKTFTFGGKSKDVYNKNPGPGAYNQSTEKVRESSRAYVMGSEKRVLKFGASKDEHSLPGPGMYDLEQNKNVTTYTFGSKNKDVYNKNPGPGEYNVDESKVKDSSRAYVIGSQKRVLKFGEGQDPSTIPGPASYDQTSINNVKTFTFGGKHVEKFNQNPGPGAYNNETDKIKDSSKNYVMGSEKRVLKFEEGTDNQIIPGPGTYDQNHQQNVKTFTFGAKSKEVYNNNPGPGAYQISTDQVKDSPKKYVMGSEKRELKFGEGQDPSTLPGPAQYEQAQNKNVTSYTFGAKNKEVYNQNPGPGAYEDKTGHIKDNSKNYVIGSEKRVLKFGEEGQDPSTMPGPGSYELSQEKKVQAYSFNSKEQTKYNKNPGPGAYNADTEKVKDSSRAYVIGSQKRELKFGEGQDPSTMPGPAQYDQIHSQNVTTYTFGAKNKDVYNKNPGPGQYDVQSDNVKESSRAYVMGSQKRELKFSEGQDPSTMPGPAQYDQIHSQNVTTYTFGAKNKDIYNKNPGPGQYDVQSDNVKESSRAYVIGSQKRELKFAEGQDPSTIPGPGMYEYNQESNNKAYTFGAKQQERYNKNPGPGEYEIQHDNVKDSSRAYVMGSQKRELKFGESQDPSTIPGPGMYAIDLEQNSKAYTFGAKSKDIYNKNPGPGQYEIQDHNVKDSSHAYVIGQQKRELKFGEGQDPATIPGPGQYDQNHPQAVKTYTFGAKQQERYNQNPGPGAYNVNQDQTKDGARAYVIGTESRVLKFGKSKDEHSIPGPASYDLAYNNQNAITYSFGIKQQDRYNKNPGPGAYEVQNDNVKDGSRAYVMGSESRVLRFGKSKDEHSIPGPGQYDASSQNNQAVTYSFGIKQQERYNKNPGPGAYQVNDQQFRDQPPSFKIGSGPRETNPMKMGQGYVDQDIPGPGGYSQDTYSMEKHDVICYKFDQASKDKPVEKIPGPGQYYLPVHFANVPKYNIPNQDQTYKWV